MTDTLFNQKSKIHRWRMFTRRNVILILIGILAVFAVQCLWFYRFNHDQSITWYEGCLIPLIACYWLVLMGMEVWREAGDRHARWKKKPSVLHNQARNTALFPALCCAVILVGTPFWLVFLVYFDMTLDIDVHPFVWLALYVMAFIAGLVFTYAGVKARRHISNHFLANLRDRQVCYQCSYDLRGNPLATCPECGFDNESLYNNDQKPDEPNPHTP